MSFSLSFSNSPDRNGLNFYASAMHSEIAPRHDVVKDGDPVKGRVLFRATFDKKSSGRPKTIGSRMIEGSRRGRYWFFEKVSFVSGRKYVASDARILMCIGRGCHCCVATPSRHAHPAQPGGPSLYLRVNERTALDILELLYPAGTRLSNATVRSRRILLCTPWRIAIAG